MQKIIYNTKVITFDEKMPIADAFLMNDEGIVFVGKNDEVLELKTDETELIDLSGKMVMPSFFDTNASIYKMIEERLKKFELEEYLEKNDEIDLNYDKFDNFDFYKNEFLEIQEEYLKNGITTVFEIGVNNKEFIFWKKLSEGGYLKLEVIAYIDIVKSKDVMDDNCKSYRKYKKHFRVGGYILKLDGELSERKAWISKKYKGEKTYCGYTYMYEEQLSFLIKNILAEKKQTLIEVNGEKTLDLFLYCFAENIKEKTEEERFRPIAKNCNFASKKQIEEMKKLGIYPSFEINEIRDSGKTFIKYLGRLRANRVQPINDFKKNNIMFLLNSSKQEVPNIFELMKIAENRVYEKKKVLGKKHKISFETALNSMIKSSSYLAFDDAFKGRIENGYKATFIVLNKDIFEDLENVEVEKVFVNGELSYNKEKILKM